MFLLKDTTQWCRRGSNPRPLGLESSTLPLSHCSPKGDGTSSPILQFLGRTLGIYYLMTNSLYFVLLIIWSPEDYELMRFNWCSVEPWIILFWKHCRSRSAGFWQSHLIRINTVFNSDCKHMLTTGMLQVSKMKMRKSVEIKNIQHDNELWHTIVSCCSEHYFVNNQCGLHLEYRTLLENV